MKKLLTLISSPVLESNSVSRHITKEFLEEFEKAHPDYKIMQIDLNGKEYLHHSLTMLNLRNYHTEGGISEYLLNEFQGVDKVLVSASTINFNYPGVLKNFLDRITFAATIPTSEKDSKSGKTKLVGPFVGKKVQIIMTMKSFVAPKNAYHVQALEKLFEFLGFTVTKSLVFGNVDADPSSGKWPCTISDLYTSDIKKAAKEF